MLLHGTVQYQVYGASPALYGIILLGLERHTRLRETFLAKTPFASVAWGIGCIILMIGVQALLRVWSLALAAQRRVRVWWQIQQPNDISTQAITRISCQRTCVEVVKPFWFLRALRPTWSPLVNSLASSAYWRFTAWSPGVGGLGVEPIAPEY